VRPHFYVASFLTDVCPLFRYRVADWNERPSRAAGRWRYDEVWRKSTATQHARLLSSSRRSHRRTSATSEISIQR